MRQGYFYIRDYKLTHEISGEIFRYLPVKNINSNNSSSPTHPIYMQFAKNSINFFYHGNKKNISNNGIHTHIKILSLQIGSFDYRNKQFTKILKEDIFNNTLELGANYKINYSSENFTYSDLCVFHNENNFSTTNYFKSLFSNKEKNSDTILSFRKLFLDFLFDLENTHIFEYSPYYAEIISQLFDNKIFNAITAKASYYYHRGLHHQEKFASKSKNQIREKTYLKNIAIAERRWINIILSEDIFEEENKWIYNSEIEIERVLFKYGKFNRERWFKRYINILKGTNSKTDIKNIIYELNQKIISSTTEWYIKRYDLWSALKFSFKRKSLNYKDHISRFMLVFPFIVVAAFYLIQNTTDIVTVIPLTYTQYTFFDKIFINSVNGLLVFLFFSAFICFISFFYENVTVTIFMPRLFMAISSAWMVFVLTEELWKISFDTVISLKLLLVSLLLFWIVVFFMTIEVKKIAYDINILSLIPRVILVFIISLIISSSVGILFINLTAEKMLTRSNYLATFFKDFHEFNEKPILIGADGLPYAYKQSCQENLKENLKKDISDEEFYDKFLSRVMVKIGIIQHHVMLRWKIYFFKWHLFEIVIFPGLWIYRSIFSLFVGIFIQLIFEEKSITEPV
jgi:hypothetical protein